VNTPKLKLLRTKYNSTASLFVDSIIIDPDLEKTLRCKSIALHWMMKDYATREQKFNDVISEEYYRKKNHIKKIEKGNTEINSMIPDTEEILKFLKQIYHNAQIPAEAAIMALAYIERFLTLTDITLHHSNWRLICLGAIMVARKVWIDKSRISNLNFIQIFPYLTIDDLATIEREYLQALQFMVSIKPSIYAKYYFALCSIADKNDTNFPLKPLSREDQERLKTLSHPNAETMGKRRRRRSSSVHSPKDPPKVVVGK
jgi:hypothetical protein